MRPWLENKNLLWLFGFDRNLFFVSSFFFLAKEFLRGHILPAASTGGGQPLSHLHTLQRDGSGRQRHPGLWRTVSLRPASQPEGGPQPDGLLSPLCGHQVRETPMITAQAPDQPTQSLRLTPSDTVSLLLPSALIFTRWPCCPPPFK